MFIIYHLSFLSDANYLISCDYRSYVDTVPANRTAQGFLYIIHSILTLYSSDEVTLLIKSYLTNEKVKLFIL